MQIPLSLGEGEAETSAREASAHRLHHPKHLEERGRSSHPPNAPHTLHNPYTPHTPHAASYTWHTYTGEGNDSWETGLSALPCLSKFILLANFLVSTNPAKSNIRMFGRGLDEKRRRKRWASSTKAGNGPAKVNPRFDTSSFTNVRFRLDQIGTPASSWPNAVSFRQAGSNSGKSVGRQWYWRRGEQSARGRYVPRPRRHGGDKSWSLYCGAELSNLSLLTESEVVPLPGCGTGVDVATPSYFACG